MTLSDLFNSAVNWLPVLLIVVLWVYFMWRVRDPKQRGFGFARSIEIEKSQEELRDTLSRLEKRVAELEKRR